MKDDSKKDGYAEVSEEHRDHMLMDVLLRITALENILMRKKVVTDEEIKNEIISLSTMIAASVSENLASKIGPDNMADLEKWVDEFSNVNKKTDRNSN